MKQFKVIQNKVKRIYYVIDKLTGQCLLETENGQTAHNTAENLNILL